MENQLTITRVPIDSVHQDPANARSHPDENLGAIQASLHRFGQAEPLVVQKGTGRVIGGNGRLAVMKGLGWTHCDVVELEIDDLTATALGIALNRTAETATWNQEALATLLQELQSQGALDGTGFDTEDIDALLAELAAEAEPAEIVDPGEQEPPEKPVSRTGDLWILGEHRLLVGDSTSAGDIERLMAGEKAALLSTDPPYCVQYTGNDRPIHDGKASGKDWTHVYREVDIADLGEFLDRVFASVLPRIQDDAGIYVWHAHVQQPTIAAVFERHGLLLHQVIVWVKPCATFGHCYYRWKHEPCAFGWKRGNKPTHGIGQLETVWEADWDGKQRITTFHPCLHPDALVLTDSGYRPIRSIEVGESVFAKDGRFHPVTDVSSHPYQSKELVRIVAEGGDVPTLASDNHPFLVWRPRRHSSASGTVGWVRADGIQVGDYTMTPAPMEEGDPLSHCDEWSCFHFGMRIAERFPEVGGVLEADCGRAPHSRRLVSKVLCIPRAKGLALLLGWLHGGGCRVHDPSHWQGMGYASDLEAHLSLHLPSVPQGRKAHLTHKGRTYMLRHVKCVERVPYTGDVWNLSVEGSPTFQTAVGMSHNTSKPTRLFETPIEQHTKPGDVVLEPFNGSGSQIIAAEKLRRRCFAIDIQPAFVDGTILRWQKATGKTATLDGRTFEDVAAERRKS